MDFNELVHIMITIKQHSGAQNVTFLRMQITSHWNNGTRGRDSQFHVASGRGSYWGRRTLLVYKRSSSTTQQSFIIAVDEVDSRYTSKGRRRVASQPLFSSYTLDDGDGDTERAGNVMGFLWQSNCHNLRHFFKAPTLPAGPYLTILQKNN